MAPKIFATGTTGYIGGDFLSLLLTTHPTWIPHTTCLVRSPSRGESLKTRYPAINLVTGTLDSTFELETEAEKADIVLHFASSDHVGAAEAIARGLKRGGGTWIHTSGTDVLLVQGGEGGRGFDDWGGIGELIGRPDSAPHRLVDKVVLATASPSVKTAIVCPSLVYGQGRGPGSQRSHQAYELTRLILERGAGFTMGTEDYMWFHVHIYDLSRLYLSLVEEAVAGGGKAVWNDKGYYLVENGEFRWNELAVGITKEACKRGLIKSDGVGILEGEEREMLECIGPALWNVEVRAKAVRARKVLEWKPVERSLMDEVDVIVESEARRAGLSSG